MAPKGGKGGGGSGGGDGTSTCPGAFMDTPSQVYFAQTVVFFAVTLGIIISLCSIRKKHPAGKKLLGLPYILALFFFFFSYTIDLINTVLLQCRTETFDTYYSAVIASTLFWSLACWVLLFVVVYTLNAMLREHHGSPSAIFKIITLVILGIVFAVTCGNIGVSSYNIWTLTERGIDDDAEQIYEPALKLRLAQSILFFLSILASGVLSLVTVFQMRKARLSGGDLLGWVIALIFSMAVWSAMSIVFSSTYFANYDLSFTAGAVTSYIQTFFQSLSFIFLLCIAKHVAWSRSVVTTTDPQAYVPVATQQPGYAYNNTNGNGQQYYYQQAPTYNHHGGTLAEAK